MGTFMGKLFSVLKDNVSQAYLQIYVESDDSERIGQKRSDSCEKKAILNESGHNVQIMFYMS